MLVIRTDFSKTHFSLSRIDLCLCTPQTSHLLQDMQYLVRGVSDPSPLLVYLNSKPAMTLPRAPWKLNAFWLNIFTSHKRIAAEISEFWLRHAAHPNLNTAWDAFKAFLRGILITEVTGIKTKTIVQKEQSAQLVCRLQAKFIASPSDPNRETWMTAQEAVDRINCSAAERKHFFNKLAFYE